MDSMDETDHDLKCNGSVLEKLSMFEKLEHRQASLMAQLAASNKHQMPPHGNESPSTMRRSDYLSKSMRSIDKDAGKWFIHYVCACAIFSSSSA